MRGFLVFSFLMMQNSESNVTQTAEPANSEDSKRFLVNEVPWQVIESYENDASMCAHKDVRFQRFQGFRRDSTALPKPPQTNFPPALQIIRNFSVANLLQFSELMMRSLNAFFYLFHLEQLFMNANERRSVCETFIKTNAWELLCFLRISLQRNVGGH